MDAIEKRTMDKVTWRLVPFLIACYFIAYLDRVNVGFANASMSKDLGLSAAAFGGAAGIFFIAYFFFEVPSNLALNRFGARLWIARIMFTWGIISGAQAFVVGETSLTRLQQFDLLSNRAATTIRAARAAWHYIFGFGGGSGGRGVADGRRERDTGRAQGQAGGGARGGADEKAFAVVFDLGLGQGIQIGDDLRP